MSKYQFPYTTALGPTFYTTKYYTLHKSYLFTGFTIRTDSDTHRVHTAHDRKPEIWVRGTQGLWVAMNERYGLRAGWDDNRSARQHLLRVSPSCGLCTSGPHSLTNTSDRDKSRTHQNQGFHRRFHRLFPDRFSVSHDHLSAQILHLRDSS